MQYLWDYGPSTVSGIIDRMEEPKPAHSSLSTIVRILEKKGFVNHRVYGKTYEYFSLISKDDYKRFSLKKLIKGYFDGSVKNMVSFLINEDELSLSDIEKLRKEIKEYQDNQNQ